MASKPVIASSNQFMIEKGVPLVGGHGKAVYPFGEMAPGDSFFVADGTRTSRSAVGETLLRAAASNFGKRHAKKFSVRKVEGGWRIWRLS